MFVGPVHHKRNREFSIWNQRSRSESPVCKQSRLLQL
jgi:hypothetical protein